MHIHVFVCLYICELDDHDPDLTAVYEALWTLSTSLSTQIN